MFNKAVIQLHKNEGISTPSLDLDSLYIAGYSDGSFENNQDLSSQQGFVILLKDKNDRTDLIHFGSWKCQRVTRSVLGAEAYAFSHTLYSVRLLAHDLSTISGQKIRTILFTDSKSLFDTISKLSAPTEKRILIDIAATRESYNKKEISNVAHTLSKYNIADCFTKYNAN